jgi:hypothetical protein
MGRRADAFDYMVAERFFEHSTELLDRHTFRSCDQARLALSTGSKASTAAGQTPR